MPQLHLIQNKHSNFRLLLTKFVIINVKCIYQGTLYQNVIQVLVNQPYLTLAHYSARLPLLALTNLHPCTVMLNDQGFRDQDVFLLAWHYHNSICLNQNVRMYSIPLGISRKLISFYMGIFTKYAEFANVMLFQGEFNKFVCIHS